MANPRVVEAILASAQRYKADPVALLATALQESGARYNAVGDQGTSFGPFQYHRGGALGTHSPAWAMSNAEIDAEAQRFAANQIHGGRGAAALQRPADPVGYASAVQAKLAQAQQILSSYRGGSVPLGAAPGSAPPSGAAVPTPSSASLTGGVGRSEPDRTALLQSIINSNAELAGIPAVTVPTVHAPTITPPAPITRDAAEPAPTATRPAKTGAYYLPTPTAKVIGTPYHGTHTIGNWESDNAIDLATPVGTPIYAAQSGTIGPQFGSLGASSSSRFAGLRLHLVTPGNEFYYAHLSRFAPGIKPGTRVKAGQVIGFSGSANGVAHLHIGARNGNPLQLFRLRSTT